MLNLEKWRCQHSREATHLNGAATFRPDTAPNCYQCGPRTQILRGFSEMTFLTASQSAKAPVGARGCAHRQDPAHQKTGSANTPREKKLPALSARAAVDIYLGTQSQDLEIANGTSVLRVR